MSELAVIVLSDVHAGPENAHPELQVPFNGPKAPRLGGVSFGSEPLASAILELVGDVPSKRRVLLCTGDLSSDCISAELDASAKFLSSLSDKLKVPKKQRLVLPGNHDLDWPLGRLAATDPWYDSKRQLKFEECITKHAPDFAFPLRGKAKVVRLLKGKLSFYLLDSAFEDRVEQTPHHGQTGESQLLQLKQYLEEAAPDSLNIVALHHHIVPFAPTNGRSDFSLLQDAADLRSLLAEHQVALLFHGHQHYPFFQQISTGLVPLSIVSSGSTTAAEMPRDTVQTFHVVKFKTLNAQAPKGDVHTRMFSVANGWQKPSHHYHHIAARRPFGAQVTKLMLDSWVDDAIVQCSATGNLRVDDFLKTKPDGDYCCPHQFKSLLATRLAVTNRTGEFELINDVTTDRVSMQRTT